jgi:hypothetical protein
MYYLLYITNPQKKAFPRYAEVAEVGKVGIAQFSAFLPREDYTAMHVRFFPPPTRRRGRSGVTK